MTEITNSVLNNVLIEETPVFKKNIYLDPYDFKLGEGRDFTFLGGTPVRSLFEKIGQGPTCRSWDGMTSTEGKECVRVNEATGRYEIVCGYAKGVETTDKEGKPITIKCQQKYNVYLSHPEPDKQYVLSLSFTAQKELSDYIRKLHSMGMEEDKVVTRITRIEPPRGSKAKYIYKFEFVEELKLEMSEIESQMVEEVKTFIVGDDSEWTVIDTADALKTLLAEKGTVIDMTRATRLVMPFSDDGKKINKDKL